MHLNLFRMMVVVALDYSETVDSLWNDHKMLALLQFSFWHQAGKFI